MGQGWLSPWAIYDETTGEWIWKGGDPLLPAWTMPNVSGNILYNTSTRNPAIQHVEHFNKILAALATYVRSNEDLSVALPLDFTIDAQPDVPRTLTWAFDSHAQITAFSISFSGVDARGNSIGETITQASGWSGETANAYATITRIRMTVRTGTGAADTMDIGIGSKLGLANDFAAATDIFKVVRSAAAGNAEDYSGVGNITATATYDKVDVSTGGAIADGDSFTIYYKTNLASIS